MSSRAWVRVQYLLPQRLLCRFIYRIARSRRPWIKNPLIRWFAHQYEVDLQESESADLESYPTFNAFFTRALKPGARPIAGGEDAVISPVDGRLLEFGQLQDGRLLQAKGIDYSLEALLGERGGLAATLSRGTYATFYLAPSNYHRVHMPLAGRLRGTRYLPGRRFSVGANTVATIRGLFCRNERVVCWFDSPAGVMAVVLVGALNVSSISTVWLGEIQSGETRIWPETGERTYGRGDELGRFNLGSTVIVLLPTDNLDWAPGLSVGQPVRLGMQVATLKSSTSA